MRIEFCATESGFDDPESAVICGISGDGKYLTFQRDAQDGDEDWGIYLEYCDQAYGGYGCIAACRVSSKLICIDLCKQLGRLVGVEGFDVAINIGASELAELRQHLLLVFRGHEQQLCWQ